MSAPQNFRSAFNGFNREDVVHYLEYLNNKHHTQVNQLTGENEYLRSRVEELEQASADQSEMEALRCSCRELQAQLEEALEHRHALEARCIGMERELEEARQAQTTVRCHVEQELESYRRAERMERQARERAELIYHRTNGVLAEAAAQVENVSGDIGTLADNVLVHLEQLKNSISGSKAALKAASDALVTLRPEEEN